MLLKASGCLGLRSRPDLWRQVEAKQLLCLSGWRPAISVRCWEEDTSQTQVKVWIWKVHCIKLLVQVARNWRRQLCIAGKLKPCVSGCNTKGRDRKSTSDELGMQTGWWFIKRNTIRGDTQTYTCPLLHVCLLVPSLNSSKLWYCRVKWSQSARISLKKQLGKIQSE